MPEESCSWLCPLAQPGDRINPRIPFSLHIRKMPAKRLFHRLAFRWSQPQQFTYVGFDERLDRAVFRERESYERVFFREFEQRRLGNSHEGRFIRPPVIVSHELS